MRTAAPMTVCALLIGALAQPSTAGDPVPFTARHGLELARDAALTWEPDAQLIYLENDEDVRPDGTAQRWGYLFYSPRVEKARGYSVSNGKIKEASDLGFDFDAPPLHDEWIDSQTALKAAEEKAGRKYRQDFGGRLSTMLLIRGAFYDKKPNETTWGLLYTSDTEPALFVVVDATRGKVVRTWRG